ncbi:winged helix-turn-helix transcriptional regulator [Muribaculum intestinale]|uniref:winged helix-turn-helix transcriptional regulator n=1 Tax=Muribaculum intestinale TaxID=1796646 RepID=UPI00339074F1
MSARGYQKQKHANTNRTKTEHKSRIIKLLVENPMITRTEIEKTSAIHVSSVQRRLDALVKDGRIRNVGLPNGSSWEVMNHSS